MLLKSWPTSVLALALGFGCAGCVIPGRPDANRGPAGQSSWNPFSQPTATYQQQAVDEEDEVPLKKLTDPNPLKLRYALWMEETGNLPEARKHYSEVLATRPKSVEAALGVARVDLAGGQLDEAEQGFRRALQLDPQSAIAHSGIGQCRAAAKDWTAAVQELTLASQGQPEDKTILYHLAVALVHAGQPAAAQVHFVQCVGDAAGHYNTALILKDSGQLAEAEAQLELALRKDPKMKDAEKWLTEIRQVRLSNGPAPPRCPAAIQPAVTQVVYQDYGQIGTVEQTPAVYVGEGAGPAIEHASGHSTSSQQVSPL